MIQNESEQLINETILFVVQSAKEREEKQNEQFLCVFIFVFDNIELLLS
jgi:hypothetical protein